MLSNNQVVQIQGIDYNTLLSNFKEIVKDEVKKFSQIKTETAEAQDRYIDTKDVCDLYDVSTVTIWEWEKKGLVKSYRIGNCKRFLLSEVMASPKLIQRTSK